MDDRRRHDPTAHDIKNGAAKEGTRASLPRVLGIWDVIAIVVGGVISMNSFINEFRNAVIGLVIILLGVPAYFYWKNKRR